MAELFEHPCENQLWGAKKEGQIIGSIAIIKKGAHQAQLRWFGVDLSIQGIGTGRLLPEAAMRFCEERSYTDVFL